MSALDFLARYFFSRFLAKSGVIDCGVQVIHCECPLPFGASKFVLWNGRAVRSMRSRWSRNHTIVTLSPTRGSAASGERPLTNLLAQVFRSHNVQMRTLAKEQIAARSCRSCQYTDLWYRLRSDAIPYRQFRCALLNTRIGGATTPPYRSCGWAANLEYYSRSARSRRKRGTSQGRRAARRPASLGICHQLRLAEIPPSHRKSRQCVSMAHRGTATKVPSG